MNNQAPTTSLKARTPSTQKREPQKLVLQRAGGMCVKRMVVVVVKLANLLTATPWEHRIWKLFFKCPSRSRTIFPVSAPLSKLSRKLQPFGSRRFLLISRCTPFSGTAILFFPQLSLSPPITRSREDKRVDWGSGDGASECPEYYFKTRRRLRAALCHLHLQT